MLEDKHYPDHSVDLVLDEGLIYYRNARCWGDSTSECWRDDEGKLWDHCLVNDWIEEGEFELVSPLKIALLFEVTAWGEDGVKVVEKNLMKIK